MIENRPGANGGIGVNQVVRADPDGHTLLAVASSALTLNPIFYKSLSYDVARDLGTHYPHRLGRQCAGGQSIRFRRRTCRHSVALAKEKPGELLYASQGVGSNGHLIAEQFRLRAGIDYRHVPYKGSAPAVQDLLGGRVQLMFDNLPSALPQIQSGNLRALAVTTAERSSLLPDVPTIAEAGFAGFDAPAWFAVLTSKAVPAADPRRAGKGDRRGAEIAGRAREAEGRGRRGRGRRRRRTRQSASSARPQVWRDVVTQSRD